MNTPPKILTIIVTWNKQDYVLDLLNSLQNLDYPEHALDVVVVDNASQDDTVALIKARFPAVKLLLNDENLGGTGGFNTGLAYAFAKAEGTYDYLWLLDNDVVVHRQALSALVSTLEHKPDVAVAGSTMLQLDFPWRINEMGAYVDRVRGELLLNRHHQVVPGWRGQAVQDLLAGPGDLSQQLQHCQPAMDVDYVAAASLLIRAPVAKQAGLWLDFFIHFDDVEWCLRIAELGHRIQVSARSLIWHVSAAAKVPSWVLYYDNRNVLYLLARHGVPEAVSITRRYIAKKTVYYSLLGKPDLADLHIQAVADFDRQTTGAKQLDQVAKAQPLAALATLLSRPDITQVLIPFTVDLQALNCQDLVIEAQRARPELKIYYLLPPANEPESPRAQLPKAIPLAVAKAKWRRYFSYWHMRGRFDLVWQSDYRPILPLSWVGKQVLFVNYENLCLRPANHVARLGQHLKAAWRIWRQA
ncbi:MAG: glycosyltransferase family 2 protein [Methylococcales bacterium]|nr:glycosyltransferase family 2 protein [Methylococcales bacterium]